jgi:hypothetical protein
MSLFRVVCKDQKEAKQKATKKCPFLYGYIYIEQYEPEDGEEEIK